jgi:hypothetical protein
MYRSALSIYYGLAIFVVGAVVFVMHPSNVPEMTNWQNGIKHEFATAFKQTMGDQPWFSDFELVYDSVNNFYTQSSDATIALLAQPDTDSDIAYIFKEVYLSFAHAIKPPANTLAYKDLPLPPMPPNFMTEEPLYNIVPYRTVVKTIDDGQVAGTSTDNSPVNTKQPWVTIQDNLTGQLYCLAVYNGTVNKYLGPCKYDYE